MPASRKKSVILAILEILRRNTDSEHRMLQKDIMARLENEYDLSVTRKSVRANLADLVDFGYPIEYDNGWYYEHEFCEAELNVLADSLFYNPNIPYSQSKGMIVKVRELGGKWYKPTFGQGINRPANPQFMYSFDVLHEAIETEKQVIFEYGDYQTDKQLHPRLDEAGNIKRYKVSPYRIVLSNGRYYLICNVDKYDNVAHFRVDRILNIALTDVPIKEARSVSGLETGLIIPEYMNGHAHMFSGKISSARLNIDKKIVNEVLDWFGMDVVFDHETGNTVDAIVRADDLSLYYWLNMYSEFARRV